MRNVIIHYHIFKNAGSSIDRILADNFGAQWSTFEGNTATSLLSVRDVEQFLAIHPELRAISSHLARPPLPTTVTAFPIIFVRNPLDRAASVYSHERRAPSNVKSSEIAKLCGFPGYVNWCLDPREGRNQGGIVIRNYQVVHLSAASFRAGHIYQADAQDSDLADVLHFLDELPFIGIVEEFELSLRLLQKTVANLWPDFQVANIRENVSPGRPHTLESRLQVVREELGPDVLDALTRENRLDFALHRAATHKFMERVAHFNLA